MKFTYYMVCPVCNQTMEIVVFSPIESRTGIFECWSCGQIFAIDKIVAMTRKITLVRLNR